MRLRDIVLVESYSTAKRVFIKSASVDIVDEKLRKFKELNQKNLLKSDEKDLGKWIKLGWDSFNNFVSKSSDRVSGKVQRSESKSNSIKVFEDDSKLVIIPLSRESSCYYGKDTKWCTAADNNNQFNEYFGKDDITLFYVIDKKSSDRYAAAVYADVGGVELFDAKDSSMSQEVFTKVTGITLDDLLKWDEQYIDNISQSRNVIKSDTDSLPMNT